MRIMRYHGLFSGSVNQPKAERGEEGFGFWGRDIANTVRHLRGKALLENNEVKLKKLDDDTVANIREAIGITDSKIVGLMKEKADLQEVLYTPEELKRMHAEVEGPLGRRLVQKHEGPERVEDESGLPKVGDTIRMNERGKKELANDKRFRLFIGSQFEIKDIDKGVIVEVFLHGGRGKTTFLSKQEIETLFEKVEDAPEVTEKFGYKVGQSLRLNEAGQRFYNSQNQYHKNNYVIKKIEGYIMILEHLGHGDKSFTLSSIKNYFEKVEDSETEKFGFKIGQKLALKKDFDEWGVFHKVKNIRVAGFKGNSIVVNYDSHYPIERIGRLELNREQMGERFNRI